MSTEDYHGQDLRGKSFEGASLDGANFDGADLRGANFADASLVGARLTNASLGTRPIAAILILVGSLAISIAAGIAVGLLARETREEFASSDWRDMLASFLMAVVVVVFLGVLVFRGVSTALRSFVAVIVAVIVVDFTVVFIAAGEIRFVNSLPLIGLLVLLLPAVIAGILGRMVGGTFGVVAMAIIAVIGGLAAGSAHGGLAAVAVSLILVFVSKRAMKGDGRDGPLRFIGHRIATHRGTRFDRADLTMADFTGTKLRHSDMASASLDGTIFGQGQVPFRPYDPVEGSA